ncbi:hypothetical protein L6452_18914 [Arctium lappa]|uniref:Uncharacterized protein n=1 Tax=Arctium lappa TaxID=4217 RepID=A0ACB9B6L1_ARCLA|nr:hypothetical protein L6452_18914 [Arctium lappa]
MSNFTWRVIFSNLLELPWEAARDRDLRAGQRDEKESQRQGVRLKVEKEARRMIVAYFSMEIMKIGLEPTSKYLRISFLTSTLTSPLVSHPVLRWTFCDICVIGDDWRKLVLELFKGSFFIKTSRNYT